MDNDVTLDTRQELERILDMGEVTRLDDETVDMGG